MSGLGIMTLLFVLSRYMSFKELACQYEYNMIAELSEPKIPVERSLNQINIVENEFLQHWPVFTEEFVKKIISEAFASNPSAPNAAVEQIRNVFEKNKNDSRT